MKSKSKKWIIWITVLIIGIIISGIALSSGSTEEKNGRASVKVERKNIVEKALAVGSIEPVTEIDVKSKVSGVVGKLYVEVGSVDAVAVTAGTSEKNPALKTMSTAPVGT